MPLKLLPQGNGRLGLPDMLMGALRRTKATSQGEMVSARSTVAIRSNICCVTSSAVTSWFQSNPGSSVIDK